MSETQKVCAEAIFFSPHHLPHLQVLTLSWKCSQPVVHWRRQECQGSRLFEFELCRLKDTVSKKLFPRQPKSPQVFRSPIRSFTFPSQFAPSQIWRIEEHIPQINHNRFSLHYISQLHQIQLRPIATLQHVQHWSHSRRFHPRSSQWPNSQDLKQRCNCFPCFTAPFVQWEAQIPVATPGHPPSWAGQRSPARLLARD